MLFLFLFVRWISCLSSLQTQNKFKGNITFLINRQPPKDFHCLYTWWKKATNSKVWCYFGGKATKSKRQEQLTSLSLHGVNYLAVKSHEILRETAFHSNKSPIMAHALKPECTPQIATWTCIDKKFTWIRDVLLESDHSINSTLPQETVNTGFKSTSGI